MGYALNYEYKKRNYCYFHKLVCCASVCVCVWCITLKLSHKLIFDQSVEEGPWECCLCQLTRCNRNAILYSMQVQSAQVTS